MFVHDKWLETLVRDHEAVGDSRYELIQWQNRKKQQTKQNKAKTNCVLEQVTVYYSALS